MKARSHLVPDALFVGVLLIAVVVVWYDVYLGLLAQALAVAIAAVAGMIIATREALDTRVTAVRSSLELLDSIRPPFRSASVRVVAERGSCPLGFRVGQVFSVDPQGDILPSVCRGAFLALEPALRGMGNAEAWQVCCDCPIKNARLTFLVRATAPPLMTGAVGS